MKKLLLSSFITLFVVGVQAQMGTSRHTLIYSSTSTQKTQPTTTTQSTTETQKPNQSSRLENNPTVQFGGDVIVKLDTTNQRNVKVATAFNGWIYSACSINVTGSGGIQIRKSIDGGLTWMNFASGLYPNTDYPAVDLAVAGTDTINLTVFLAGINHSLSGNTYDAWVDRYNGTTGAFINENFSESNATNKIYDIAIATDSRHPSFVSTPFSIAVTYSKNDPIDSIIYSASTDGGVTYTTREGIYGTAGFCGKVAIAYGASSTYSNGRYFLAWESKVHALDNVCNVLFSHTVNDPTSTFQTPIYIDSANASTAGKIGHPRISCSNDGIDNDSSNITAVVVVDRAWSSIDYDVLAMYSKTAVYSARQNWHLDAISSSNNYETGGDIAFNDSTMDFDVTYFDSTANKIAAVHNNYNIPVSNFWTMDNSQYNDLLTNVIQPFPRVSVNPILKTPNFVWNSEGASGKGISLFDELSLPLGIPVATNSLEFNSAYPNPSNGIVNFDYTLKSNEHVQIAIYNMFGQEVISTIDLGNQGIGNFITPVNLSSLADGIYVYKFTLGTESKTGNVVVAH